jgi:hypothetical protein
MHAVPDKDLPTTSGSRCWCTKLFPAVPPALRETVHDVFVVSMLTLSFIPALTKLIGTQPK